jgi:hypothetical protein
MGVLIAHPSSGRPWWKQKLLISGIALIWRPPWSYLVCRTKSLPKGCRWQQQVQLWLAWLFPAQCRWRIPGIQSRVHTRIAEKNFFKKKYPPALVKLYKPFIVKTNFAKQSVNSHLNCSNSRMSTWVAKRRQTYWTKFGKLTMNRVRLKKKAR